jgi:hypothetical protein
MPSYTMIDKETGEEIDMILSLAEREQVLLEGKYTQKLSTAKFVSQTVGTLRQAGDGWKEVLSRVKSGSAKDNTVND